MKNIHTSTVAIIIATHNRLNYLPETLDSVLKQKLEDKYALSIVISDNSTNSDTEKYFSSNIYPNVTYTKRTPSVSMVEHFNIILKEIDTDFFMIFHDDDVMEENMVMKLLDHFTPSTVAVSSYAYRIINNKKITKKPVIDPRIPNPITTKKELLDCLVLGTGGPPFPGYLYRRVVSQIQLDSKYKIHFDAYFMIQILEYGSIFVIKDPLYYYRTHDGQDSFHCDIIGLSRLVNYTIKEGGYTRKYKPIVDWRLKIIYNELRVRLLKKDTPSITRILHFIKLCIASFNILLMGKIAIKYAQRKLTY